MKQDFRIKLDGDTRAVSYTGVDAETSQSGDIVVTQKGVRTMVRRYLKSMNKDLYKLPIVFKYYKASNGLDIYIDGITGDELREILTRFDQFTAGSATRDVKTNYLISFDLRSLSILNGTPTRKRQSTPRPTPAPQSSGKPKATDITIIFHEGTGEFDGVTFTSWQSFQDALSKIYDNWNNNPSGYDKVKIEINWENGKKLIDRVDVGNNRGDFNPNNEFIGEYIKKQNSAMYASNFDLKERNSVSWEDPMSSSSAPQTTPPQMPTNTPAIPSNTNPYILTETEMITSYGGDWQKEVDWFDEMNDLFGQTLSNDEVQELMKGIDVQIVDKNGDDFFINIEATSLNLALKYPNYTRQQFLTITEGLTIIGKAGSDRANFAIASINNYIKNNNIQ